MPELAIEQERGGITSPENILGAIVDPESGRFQPWDLTEAQGQGFDTDTRVIGGQTAIPNSDVQAIANVARRLNPDSTEPAASDSKTEETGVDNGPQSIGDRIKGWGKNALNTARQSRVARFASGAALASAVVLAGPAEFASGAPHHKQGATGGVSASKQTGGVGVGPTTGGVSAAKSPGSGGISAGPRASKHHHAAQASENQRLSPQNLSAFEGMVPGPKGLIPTASTSAEATTSNAQQDCVDVVLAKPKIIAGPNIKYGDMVYPGDRRKQSTFTGGRLEPTSAACLPLVTREAPRVFFRMQRPKNHKAWVRTKPQDFLDNSTRQPIGDEGGKGQVFVTASGKGGMKDKNFLYRCSPGKGITHVQAVYNMKVDSAVDGHTLGQRTYFLPLKIIPVPPSLVQGGGVAKAC